MATQKSAASRVSFQAEQAREGYLDIGKLGAQLMMIAQIGLNAGYALGGEEVNAEDLFDIDTYGQTATEALASGQLGAIAIEAAKNGSASVIANVQRLFDSDRPDSARS